MPQVEIGGIRIRYEQAGSGPLLVLVHGFVGDGRSTWHHQIDDLSDEFTVVAWDGPGAGRSSDPPSWFRMPDYADCLAGFVDSLELGRPHLAGLSFGGALALELFRRHPRLPASLVLAGAYAGWAGSLPADVVKERLARSLRSAGLPPRAIRGRAAADHVLDDRAGGADRRVRPVGRPVPSRRFHDHGPGVSGGRPAGRAAPHRCPHPVVVRRPGPACTVERGPCPALVDSGLHARRHARCGACEQASRRPTGSSPRSVVSSTTRDDVSSRSSPFIG